MTLDQLVVAVIAPLALWICLSGIDDLFITAVFLFRPRARFRPPTPEELATAPQRPIAIFVPLWHEHAVIERMLDHNLAVIRYPNVEFFVGAYPNDAPTCQAVTRVAARHPNVHLAVCPHPGPTSKADCLNWIWRAMENYEQAHGVRFEVIVTHDAEDLIHPASLGLIDYYAERHDMVQIPVLPLPLPLSRWVHGLYCDEFAEYQTKDIPVRQRLGGFLPSNGVGCGFTRAALEELAATRGGRIFEPDCLTEDYENGFAIHSLDRPQIFVPLSRDHAGLVATREYFPDRFGLAVRQRTRWVAGISLQGWERHHWQAPWRQVYWLWRDRKGLVGNLLTPIANCVGLYALAGWMDSVWRGQPWGLARAMPDWLTALCVATSVVTVCHVTTRAACATGIYGLGFALGLPVRLLVGNWLNCAATVAALRQFVAARWRHRRMAWGKTEHLYPEGFALGPHRPRLGEVLVRMRCLEAADLSAALDSQPPGCRLGEHLLYLRKLSEENLYLALSRQHGIPLAAPAASKSALRAARILPAEVIRRWKVLPFQVESGRVVVGAAEIPSEKLKQDLERFVSLQVTFRLLPRSHLERLVEAMAPATHG